MWLSTYRGFSPSVQVVLLFVLKLRSNHLLSWTVKLQFMIAYICKTDINYFVLLIFSIPSLCMHSKVELYIVSESPSTMGSMITSYPCGHKCTV